MGAVFDWVKVTYVKHKGMSLWGSVLGFLYAVFFFKISSGRFWAQAGPAFQFQNPRGPPKETLVSPGPSGLRSRGGGKPLMQDGGCGAQDWRRRPLIEVVTSSKWRRCGRGRGRGSPKDFPSGGGAEGGWGSSLLTCVQSHCHPSLMCGQPPRSRSIARGDRDQPQTPPPANPPPPPPPPRRPISRVETGSKKPKVVLPHTAQSGSSTSQGPVNRPLWEAWSAEAAGAAGGVEYLGG